jgi:hypothetical protein
LIALIVRRLLFTSTPEQFASLWPQADAEYFLLKEHGSVTEAGDRGFRSLFEDEADTGGALERLCPQALWTRAPDGYAVQQPRGAAPSVPERRHRRRTELCTQAGGHFRDPLSEVHGGVRV